jgi:phage terminase large subunit-like protein
LGEGGAVSDAGSGDRDYDAIALQYANDVVSGVIPACKWVVATCLRHLDDLARQSTEAFPYRYEPEFGARLCYMLELLPHIKGRWTSKTIHLEPWQIFIQMTLFSWVCAGGDRDGLRRFRTDYEEVPRKNAKSTISAGRGLYMLGPDGEQGAECYSAATTRDQAKIVWDVARAMAKRTPAYCRRFGVDVLAHSLVAPDTESFFKALSAEDDSLDGLNPHFANVDELHAHRTRGVWDVLETATGSREQSLLSTITTAGSNRSGICYEVRTYLTKILNAVLARHPDICAARGYKLEGGSCDDETFFGIIYTIDDDDAWDDPAAWAKANPNLGVSVKLDDIARLCRKAQQTPSAQPNFKTKRLNVWINADSAWMDMLKWDAGADARLSLQDFAGEECFAAVDMASNLDIAPIVYLFSRLVDETNKTGELETHKHYYAFGRFFVPEDAIEESDNSQYAGWEQTGRLITTDGNIIDQNAMQDELREARTSFQIREVAYDPFQATKFATELLAEGFPMVEFGATVKNFSAPMKQIEALVRAGRFHHDGDPVFAWMMSNVVAHVDKKDNVFPNKQTANNKIDGAVALIMAMGRAMHAPAPSDWRPV